jgi:hypothetical protein
LIYYFGPDADQDWVWITPGAVVAMGLPGVDRVDAGGPDG